MSKSQEEKTVTLTASELENIIRSAVKNALRDLKEEENLPVNEVDERQDAPAAYSLLELLITMTLSVFMVFMLVIFGVCTKLILDSFNAITLLLGLSALTIAVLCFFSVREIQKAKKIEVLSTIFSAIMAFSTLLVAIASAVFAYQALK